MRDFFRFIAASVRVILTGRPKFYAWLALLGLMLVIGIHAYAGQYRHGLIETSMRDPVSWGFYIGNFTFLVGVAAAAVVLVIPAYVYDWKPIKEIALTASNSP